ncbi:MAG: hypothetical protein WAM71_10385 [Candidatus Korobacteraceae bacterium]
MTSTSIGALSAPAGLASDSSGLGVELDSLRLLLLRGAEALGAGDAVEVQQACNELASGAVNLRPSFGELFPNRNGLTSVECEQRRRRILLPVLEARAFYLAALRRWRRSLCLRRNLMDLRRDAPAGDEAEVSRWC